MKRSLYFFRNTAVDIIKIGVTARVDARRSTLEYQCGVPLEILLVVPKGEHYEPLLHAAFADSRLLGEWFSLTGDLLDITTGIETIPAFIARMEPVIRANLTRMEESRAAVCRQRAERQAAQRWERLAEAMDVPGKLPGLKRTPSGDDPDASVEESTMTRAGLEPATYGLKGPASIPGHTPSDADIGGSVGDSAGDEGRSAPENGAESPEKSPDEDGGSDDEPPSRLENGGAGEAGGLMSVPGRHQ